MMQVPSISIHASRQQLVDCIEKAEHGVIVLKHVPKAPFSEILQLIRQSSAVADRLNAAYTKNLVYKDAHGTVKNNDSKQVVDRKRVLDLSAERLAAIAKAEPELVRRHGALATSLAFWEKTVESALMHVVPAVAAAVGSEAVANDVAFKYRMVEYYEPHGVNGSESQVPPSPPRCSEHRDFGSFTIIQSSHTGLQVKVNDQWMNVVTPTDESDEATGSAVLLFGWCTQIRSNQRIPAALHRVDPDCSADRVSTVLFCAPKSPDTPLEPVVRANESQKYVSGIKCGQLRGRMARKWRVREGTLNREDMILEEREILMTGMRTQDDVVQRLTNDMMVRN